MYAIIFRAISKKIDDEIYGLQRECEESRPENQRNQFQ